MFLVLPESQILKPVLPRPAIKFLQWNLSWLLREIGSNIMSSSSIFCVLYMALDENSIEHFCF